MPVPTELMPFFKQLVEKSKKSEINWEAAGRPDAYTVRFPDFAIQIVQEGTKPYVLIRLHNDDGMAVTDFKVTNQDEEWIMAVSLINSADRKVRKERPMLEDMAPTVLELLGVEPPGYMTGKSLVAGGEDEA